MRYKTHIKSLVMITKVYNFQKLMKPTIMKLARYVCMYAARNCVQECHTHICDLPNENQPSLDLMLI